MESQNEGQEKATLNPSDDALVIADAIYQTADVGQRIATAFERIATALERIADQGEVDEEERAAPKLDMAGRPIG